MYADDHQIFASGLSTSVVEGKLLSEGNTVRSLNGKGKLATNECSEISIHVTGLQIDFIMRTIEIYQIIRLESELNFSEHISSVCKKGSQQIGVFETSREAYIHSC